MTDTTHAWAVRTQGLRKTFRGGASVAVAGLDLAVPRGGVHALLGPNGSGKTTALRMLLGLLRPDSGTMEVLGHTVPDELPQVIDRVGAIVESPKFFPTMSAHTNLALLARAVGVPVTRVGEVLEQVGLAARARDDVGRYSLGMKQRLAIASTLLKDPELLIFDEPTNGLDPAGIREIRDTMRGLAERGKTVLVSSHVLAEVEQTVDDVLIISKGKLVAQGPIGDLAASAVPVVRCRSPQAERLQELLAGRGAAVNRLDAALAIRGPSAAEVGQLALDHGIVLHELLTEQPNLEDLFLRIAGTRRADS